MPRRVSWSRVILCLLLAMTWVASVIPQPSRAQAEPDASPVVVETPVETPDVTELPVTAEASETPEPTAPPTDTPAPDFGAAVVPSLTLNGQGTSITVSAATPVTIAASPSDMHIHAWASGNCAGVDLGDFGNGDPLAMPFATVISFQAYDPANPTSVSDCLSVTWVAVPLLLTLNGVPLSQTVFVGTDVTLATTPSGASIRLWSGSGCQGASVGSVTDGYVVDPPDPGTFSFQAADGTHTSACLDATWVSAAGTLLLNGQTSSVTLAIGEQLTLTTSPAGMRIRVWQNGDCSGESVTTGDDGDSLASPMATVFSFRAYFVSDPSVLSECRSATWASVPVSLLLNGQAGSLALTVGNGVTISTTPAGRGIHLWAAGDCSGTQTTTVPDGYVLIPPGPLVVSFQAYDLLDTSNVSACLSVLWTPAEGGLLLNGQTESLTVALNTTVTVTTVPSGMFLRAWMNGDCSGQAIAEVDDGFSNEATTPTVISFRAFLPSNPSVMTACRSVTWEFVPVGLTLNGQSTSQLVLVGTPVTAETVPAGGAIGLWVGGGCDGPPVFIAPDGYVLTPPGTAIISFRARDAADVSNLSACLTVSWVDELPTPTDPPTATEEPTATTPPSPTPTATATTAPTATATVTNTATLTATATQTPTATPTNTPTKTPTATVTNTPTLTPTATSVPIGLTVNGQATSQSLPMGASVTLHTIPAGLLVKQWANGDCSGPFDRFRNDGEMVSSPASPTVLSFQPYDSNGTMPSTLCLSVTWSSAPVSLTLNGQARSTMAYVGSGVTLATTPAGRPIHVWTNANCSGGASFDANDGSVQSPSTPTTLSFQAYDAAYSSNTSACFSAVWIPASGALLLNGQSSSLTLALGTSVTLTTAPAGLTIRTWMNGDCSGSPSGTLPDGTVIVGSANPAVQSFGIYYSNDVGYLSACLSVTWSATPLGLALNGQPTSQTLSVYQPVQLATTPSGKSIHVWQNGTCNGDPSATISDLAVQAYPFPAIYSYQAFDPANSAMVSPCLRAVWTSAAGALQLNGISASQTVGLGQSVTVTTSPAGLQVYAWVGGTCSGELYAFLTDGQTLPGFAIPKVISFRVVVGNDVVGSCLTMTWSAPTPTATSTSTATATNAPTSTPTNTPTTQPTATATATFVPSNTPTSTPTATSTATNTPTATAVPTDTATATLTPTHTPTATETATATTAPTNTPTATVTPSLTPSATATPVVELLLNGQPHSISVLAGAVVTLTTNPPGFGINSWTNDQCSGTPLLVTDGLASLPFAGVGSFQAFEPAHPSKTSACLTVTWLPVTPSPSITPSPTATRTPTATFVPIDLLLNGQATSITVLKGAVVTLTTSPSGMGIHTWTNDQCSGTPLLVTDGLASLPFAGVGSFQAFDPAHPTNASACRTITWVDPTATVVATSTSTATSVPTATATSTAQATASPTETSVPTATATTTVMVTASPTATTVPTNTATATDVPTETPTEVSTSSPTATNTVVPTATSTMTEVPAETPTATATIVGTETSTATVVPTSTATTVPSETSAATATSTLTSTVVPTPSATASATSVPTGTATSSATAVPTSTAMPSETPTDEPTATGTMVPSATATAPPTSTATTTTTPEPTAAFTATATAAATSTPQTGAVVVRVSTASGGDLPEGLAVCIDEQCQSIGLIASTGLASVRLPSGSGAVFSDVGEGMHRVEVRDTTGAVLVAQQITVAPGETLSLTLTLPDNATSTATVTPSALATSTPVSVSDLPKTGSGMLGGTGWLPILAMVASLMCAGTAIVTGRQRRNQ